ncbi:sulfide:quinone oxidoreductase [Actinocorallia herbida]|uniref:Sulfide:quinone oxidoreductase n=1 Tax=Actinocorallia herbida TaxID=58109 RepID=A0A3N1CVZ0_9ACTN|nr:FAD/NAD(P)-binding oxidoreductase [Actinocorallia herbida]ROO85424.1 sulfide:quinone oxidoreductase [Actinocorallia herbida]
MRVLVLGAGFGGLELTARLSEELGDTADIVLIDKAEGFVFGFSKLDVMFGRTSAEEVRHAYADVVKPGVRFIRTTIRVIDPERVRVETDAGPFEADVMVVALGADLDPSATPGLVEAGHEFYTVPGAFALRDVLASFGGGRVVVGVTSTPFKCPPAPSETALMLHDFLTARGLRETSEIALVMPLGTPIPPSPAASAALLTAFAERGISWHPERLVRALDPDRKVAVLADGAELPFDLFLGVPVHRAPDVVLASGMCEDGWIPVDPRTLETRYPNVYAVGDVTSVGTPKAGVFAEGQAGVVAARLIARARSGADSATYNGTGTCYLEFGADRVARVEVTFLPGHPPNGTFDPPDRTTAHDKSSFGTTRVHRWFDRPWTPH